MDARPILGLVLIGLMYLDLQVGLIDAIGRALLAPLAVKPAQQHSELR
ncbi:hypothetical protein [Novosphingobium album (ex Hu et al. 2023)]|uniref:MFS transporter n=1 Tax=Novosphingobium album (ex Hu et al. 2023) TaxID=2930093 RepID=A0ABT0B6V2_9SPHN|nr:hypothetical protein [Novosphingobium album (ex Hu et al. 2023)]MCJ2180807.1 hypothetical protein [Novosphingobium album (ex Hu et al. 2023)]